MSPSSQDGASRAPQGLGRGDRIRRRRDFLRIQQGGRRSRSAHFVWLCSPADHGRVGVTVTKRVAPAVGRNRIKRLVREVFRRNRALFPADADLVVIARRGASTLGYAEVLDEARGVSATLRGGHAR